VYTDLILSLLQPNLNRLPPSVFSFFHPSSLPHLPRAC
jgi:hypothetical protein